MCLEKADDDVQVTFVCYTLQLQPCGQSAGRGIGDQLKAADQAEQVTSSGLQAVLWMYI
jgi:hypothetical protein